MPLGNTLRREARVAFSLKAQPLGFRIAKWIVALGLGVLLWREPFFWVWVLGALVLSLTLHFVWRWKTRGWTRPWGGWNDVQS